MTDLVPQRRALAPHALHLRLGRTARHLRRLRHLARHLRHLPPRARLRAVLRLARLQLRLVRGRVGVCLQLGGPGLG